MPRTSKPPAYRLHKASGQAVVTINKKDRYLGPYGSAKSRELYAQLLANPPAAIEPTPPLPSAQAPGERSMEELIAAFWLHCKEYHVDRTGQPSTEQANYKALLRRLRKFSGDMRIKEFGPLTLIKFRETLIEEGMLRRVINSRIDLVRFVFNWGVSQEVVPNDLANALQKVESLKKGKSKATESKKVKLVSEESVEAVLPFCNHVIAAMIQLQRFTGGYVLVPPSPGMCHPTGRPYTYVTDRTLTDLATISPVDRGMLIDVARTLTQIPPLRFAPAQPLHPHRPFDPRLPSDDFSRRADWPSLLEKYGWKYVGTSGDGAQLWCRPGKSDGTSATLNFAGNNMLHVFSANAAPLEQDQSYSAFSFLVHMEFDGDYACRLPLATTPRVWADVNAYRLPPSPLERINGFGYTGKSAPPS